MAQQYSLLIGGIGDDAHSVGIGLLALGFKEAGYAVRNLGIRNELSVFFEYAPHFDVIMISNKNGHAELYLEEFPRLMSEYRLQYARPNLWYLGGSLSVSESDFYIKKKFINLGFNNVYPRPVGFTEILTDIREDLVRNNIKQTREYNGKERLRQAPKMSYESVSDRKWTARELDEVRQQVLLEWPTGADLLGKEAGSPAKNAHTLDAVLWKGKMSGGPTLMQPRTGVADIAQQTSKLQYLEQQGSDISSVQLDAASRSKMYHKAKQGREMSKERKGSMLNGFPIPIYRTAELRKMIFSLHTPFQLRGGGPDHRFTYEIALNAGITGVEGGFMCYLLPYDKLTTPTDSLRYWQYVDRLSAWYEEQFGICVNREYFGVLTATLIEPSLAIVVNVIQAILSAQQGVRSITVGYAEQGNRVQDIAAMRALEELVNHYLHQYNFRQCRVTTVFHQFMAAFPMDRAKAEELIFNSTITANLARATKMMVKTAAEAFKIPDRFDNAEALALCKKAVREVESTVVNQSLVEVEKNLITLEVNQIMDAVIELGNGSVALGAIKAIEEGIIDVPWSPNVFNRNKVVSVRDVNGAVRFYDFGNLPFNSYIKSYHLEKVNTRKNMERDSSVFSLLEKDLTRIWKNDYVRWPLDNSYVT